MNIHFNYLKIKNFLSFGNKETEYHFEHGKITNVKGRNLDIEIGKENGSSNGSGKSSIYQAIVYAVYGKGINEIKQDEFINITNGKGMSVELSLKSDGKEIRIVRTRKPNSVQLFVDGEDQTRDSISNTSELIEEFIGVNYDTFVLSFLMTTAVQPLLARKPSEQRNFMEDLLGMNTLSARADKVKRIRDDAQIELKLIEKDIDHADEFNQREQELFDSNKEKFEKYKKNKTLRLESLNESLKNNEWVIEKEDEVRDVFSQLEASEENLSSARKKLSDLKKAISEENGEISNIKLKINELSSSSDTIKSKLADEKAGLKQAKDSYKKASNDLASLEGDVSVVEEVADLVESIEKLEKNKKSLEEVIEKRKTEIEKLSSELEHLRDESCPYCKQQWNNDELKSKIEETTQTLSGMVDSDEDTRIELTNIKHAIETDASSLDGYDDKYINGAEDILDQYDAKKREVSQLEADIKRHTDNTERFEESLKYAEAQQCEIPSMEGAVDDHKKTLAELEGSLEGIDKAASDALDDAMKKRKQAENTGFDSIVQFERKLNEVNGTRNELESLKKEENPHDDPAKNPPNLRDIDDLKKKEQGYVEEVKHCKYLIKLLTDSKSFIRRNIIGRYIPYLNKMINTYADRLDSPHICEIENDLSVKIEYMRKPVSYHSLSAGERLKLDVGVSMALRDLMAMIGVKSGFLMVDELFDSALDTQSKRNVFKLIKERFETVMLVSHSGEFDDKCDSKITVTKENGFSWLDA